MLVQIENNGKENESWRYTSNVSGVDCLTKIYKIPSPVSKKKMKSII